MTVFELHKVLEADCIAITDLQLSRVLLMNDNQYPWLILVPRRAGIREAYELNAHDRDQLWTEINSVSERLMQHFGGHKLNVAALGNMVPQLHVHLIVRFENDPAWPGPVWGAVPAKPYAQDELAERIEQLRGLLDVVDGG